jgi:hypothetical protein
MICWRVSTRVGNVKNKFSSLRNRTNTLLPEQFATAHQLCFIVHDIMTTLLVSGQRSAVFNTTIELRDEADRLALEQADDRDCQRGHVPSRRSPSWREGVRIDPSVSPQVGRVAWSGLFVGETILSDLQELCCHLGDVSPRTGRAGS